MENIDPRHLLVRVARILKKLKIPYLVTGGIAVLVWGRPRFTADIDIIVELRHAHLEKLEAALRALGRAGYIDREMMEYALERKGEFNFIDGKTGIKVDFWVVHDDAFNMSSLKRKIPKKVLGETVYFISPEDLILIKLKWHKESESSRQLEDVESIVKISGSRLDMAYLKKWAKRLGVEHIWNSVK